MIAQVATALVFFAGEGVDPAVAAATQAAVKERLAREGAEPVDLSAEHRALFTKTLFADFTAPPPAFLPPELAATWTRANEACAEQLGPTGPQLSPPQRVAAAAHASHCKESIGAATWELLLLAKHVQRVVEVELGGNLRTRQGASISAWLLDPTGAGRTISAMDVDADRVVAAAVKALDDLLAGAGIKVPASPHRMPSVGAPELAASSFSPPAGLAQVPATCTGLPSRLEVFPPGKNITRAIEAAYQTLPADKRTGKPLRCDLVLYPDDVAYQSLAFARLGCPPSQANAAGTTEQGPKVVARLVDQTVAALCWAQRPQ